MTKKVTDFRNSICVHLTLSETAEKVDRPISTVQGWLAAGLPSRKSGRNRLIRVEDLIEFLADRREKVGSIRRRLQERRWDARATQLELENAKTKRELVEHDAVKDFLANLRDEITGQLVALPRRSAHDLAAMSEPTWVMEYLQSACHSIRVLIDHRIEDFANESGPTMAVRARLERQRRRLFRSN